MSRETKIALAIVGGLVLLCLCGGLAGCLVLPTIGQNLGERMMIDEPEEIEALAEEIADYDLPPGYQEEGGFDMFFAKILVIDAGEVSDRPVIMFMQMAPNVNMDRREARVQIEQSMRRELEGRNLSLEWVDDRSVTIRDQEVTLDTYEGVDEDGVPFRQLVSDMFEGKSGSIMFVIAGRTEGWNQAEINAFVNSIR